MLQHHSCHLKLLWLSPVATISVLTPPDSFLWRTSPKSLTNKLSLPFFPLFSAFTPALLLLYVQLNAALPYLTPPPLTCSPPTAASVWGQRSSFHLWDVGAAASARGCTVLFLSFDVTHALEKKSIFQDSAWNLVTSGHRHVAASSR